MHWKKWRSRSRPKDSGGIGLRDLVSFNKSLLAKQIWRILTTPQSLLARVVKQKYFKHGSVLDATVRSNASFAWRSRAWSRDLIKKGMRWKVGSWNLVRMASDSFVEGFPHGLPQQNAITDLTIRACDFIDCERQWDKAKLNAHFSAPVVEVICRTTIKRVGEDLCFWKFDEKGKFSVKSGYLAEIGYYDPDVSMSIREFGDWNKLVWNLDVTPKIKILMWRVLNDIIPVPVNLRSHKIPITGLCEGCKKAWGTTIHCCFFCKATKKIWKSTPYWSIMSPLRDGNMMELAVVVRAKFPGKKYELWVMLLAIVWLFLCDMKHSPEGRRLLVNINVARDMLHTFHAARRSLQVKNPFGVEVGEKVWSTVGVGIFRLDVDVCVNYEAGLFGFGAVVRDDQGNIRAILMNPATCPIYLLDAEVNALLK